MTVKDNNTSVPTKKTRKRKSKNIEEPVLIKPSPKETDYIVLLLRLEDGRILALGDKKEGDEIRFKDVLIRNSPSLFKQFRLDPAEDLAKFLPEKHVFYVSEVLN